MIVELKGYPLFMYSIWHKPAVLALFAHYLGTPQRRKLGADQAIFYPDLATSLGMVCRGNSGLTMGGLPTAPCAMCGHQAVLVLTHNALAHTPKLLDGRHGR